MQQHQKQFKAMQTRFVAKMVEEEEKGGIPQSSSKVLDEIVQRRKQFEQQLVEVGHGSSTCRNGDRAENE